MPDPDVVITGMGIASPIGVGRDDAWDSIRERRSGVRALPHLASAGWLAPFGGSIEDFNPKELIQPRKSIKVMCREIQLASATAEMAMRDAGLSDAQLEPERFGVIGAASVLYCDLEELRIPFIEWLKQEDFDIHRWSREAMGELYPLWMLKYLPNMAACHIGIRYDARGPNNTISVGDVSPLLAIKEASDVIVRGLADVMIVGGTGSRLNMTDLLWHRGARLAQSNGHADPGTICRPFDAARCGIVNGEGAAQIVLESRAHAEARGARVLARVLGTATRTEPTADSLTPTGNALRRAIRAAMSAAGLRPEDIAYVNAHGNSTLEEDPAEAQAIRDTLGEVPVTAPKSYFGNVGYGGGLVELCVSLLAMEHDVIPPTLNHDTPDADCPINVVTDLAPFQGGAILKLNFNPMGQAAATLIAPP